MSRTRLSNIAFTFHFHELEKAMATHSSVLAWRIPGTREPGGLLSMGSHRVGHDWSDLAAAEMNRKINCTLWRERWENFQCLSGCLKEGSHLTFSPQISVFSTWLWIPWHQGTFFPHFFQSYVSRMLINWNRVAEWSSNPSPGDIPI